MIQHLDDELDNFSSHPRSAPTQACGENQQHGPDNLIRQHLADPRRVGPDQIALNRPQILALDAIAGKRSESGVDAVNRFRTFRMRFDDAAGLLNILQCLRADGHPESIARHGLNLGEVERLAIKLKRIVSHEPDTIPQTLWPWTTLCRYHVEPPSGSIPEGPWNYTGSTIRSIQIENPQGIISRSLTHNMLQVAKHWTVLLLGMTATGLSCAAVAPFAVSPRGAVGPTIFQAESPITATIAMIAALGAAFAVSVLVGRIINTAVGLFVLGWGIGVLAMRTETIQEIAMAGEPSLWLLAGETFFWAVCLLVMTVLMFRFSGSLQYIVPKEFERAPHPLKSRDALKSAIFGMVVLPIVAVMAQTPMKGQVLMAIFLGSMLAGLFGRLSTPHVQPVLLFVTPCLFGVVGQIWGLMQMKLSISESFVLHTIPALSFPLPIDYAAGSLMGVAFGLGWAKSFLHHEDDEEEHAGVATT